MSNITLTDRTSPIFIKPRETAQTPESTLASKCLGIPSESKSLLGRAGMAIWNQLSIQSLLNRIDRVAVWVFIHVTRVDLISAAEKGQVKVVNRLIEMGAEVNQVAQSGNTPLLRAVQAKHVAVVRALLEAGADVEAADKRGIRCLGYAALSGDVDLCRLLLDHRADVNAQDHRNNTALIIAATLGHHEIVSMLLEAEGIAKDIINQVGYTALMCAAQEGKLQCAEDLIKAGANKTIAAEGWTALSLAIEKGHAQVAAKILENDPSLKASHGAQALHAAVKKGDEATLTALLDIGLDVNAYAEGKTLLTYAAELGNASMTDLLLKKGANCALLDSKKMSPLLIATTEGHEDTARVLINGGANVNEEHPTLHRSLLLHAASLGRAEIVASLIRGGAHPTSTNSSGATALHLAIMGMHLDTVRTLLALGADPKARDKRGLTPLMWAADLGFDQSISVLIEGRAGVDAITATGLNALTIAVTKGHVKTVQALLEKGAKVNGDALRQIRALQGLRHQPEGYGSPAARHLSQKTKTDGLELIRSAFTDILEIKSLTLDESALETARSRLPLYCAVVKGHVEIAEALLKAGAQVDSMDNQGTSMLTHAAMDGRIELVELLCRYGANVNTQNCFGITPLMAAALRNHDKVIGCLLQNKANSTIQDQESQTALELAASSGHVEAVHALIGFI